VLIMSAGIVGLTEIYTPGAAVALNAHGNALRERLNTLCQAAGASVHTIRDPIRSSTDAARSKPKLKELFFFDMLAHGVWLAPRGMMAL
jgi:glutamate-1-semialdehyde 2,1-aminomutase